MKTVLIVFALLNMILLGSIAGLFLLSEVYPFHPAQGGGLAP
jgi:hypothetical protein